MAEECSESESEYEDSESEYEAESVHSASDSDSESSDGSLNEYSHPCLKCGAEEAVRGRGDAQSNVLSSAFFRYSTTKGRLAAAFISILLKKQTNKRILLKERLLVSKMPEDCTI